MIKILKESLQDINTYLLSSELKQTLKEEIPDIETMPDYVAIDVCTTIVDLVAERFPNEMKPKIVGAEVLKVQGDESEVLSPDHNVIEFNGILYDFTAHQFSDSYNQLLSYNEVPVTQKVITSERQVNDKISSVKSYALIVSK